MIQKLLPILEQFLFVLEQEKNALKQLDTEQLSSVSAEKNRLLDTMLPLSQQIAAALPEDAQLSDFMTHHLKHDSERQLVDRFIELSQTAERQHLENGATLIRLAQINEGLLKILLGHTETENTYESKIKGRKRPSQASTSLGKA